MVLIEPNQTNSDGRFPPRVLHNPPHPGSVQHFIRDLEEDTEDRLVGLVTDHTEVLMLVADRRKTQNNRQLGRLSQNQQEDI